jgi:hypothetical protein
MNCWRCSQDISGGGMGLEGGLSGAWVEREVLSRDSPMVEANRGRGKLSHIRCDTLPPPHPNFLLRLKSEAC